MISSISPDIADSVIVGAACAAVGGKGSGGGGAGSDDPVCFGSVRCGGGFVFFVFFCAGWFRRFGEVCGVVSESEMVMMWIGCLLIAVDFDLVVVPLVCVSFVRDVVVDLFLFRV